MLVPPTPTKILPTQEELHGHAGPLLRILADRIVAFREQHLHEGSDYHDAITNGQKPLAIVSQCIDGRQPVHTITGMPLGKLIAQSSIAGFLHEYPDSPAAWASILFSVKDLGAPVIIKLGHTGCGGAKALVQTCWNADGKDAPSSPADDPVSTWLSEAHAMTRNVIAEGRKANADLTQTQAARLLEEELVRDGVRKLSGFVDAMEKKGILEAARRPVIEGLLFEIETAKLYHLQPTGNFKLLSETLG
jgi:carbonic anhydrase